MSDKPITTYRGCPIYTLDTYVTPYYWTPRRYVNGYPKLGPMDHFQSIKTLERRIDKVLDAIEANKTE
jgi:hypothetical protein